MGAYVDHEFENGFVLDEGRLRKVAEILMARQKQFGADCRLTFKVYRSDTLTYTTEDLEQILREDNGGWSRLVRLTFSIQASDFSLSLDFDEDGTRLHIEGNDRDVVFLVFSEIKQYLSSEVNTVRIKGYKVRNLLSSAFLLCGAVYSIASFARVFGETPFPADTVLQSQDLQLKLNFLVESISRQFGTPFMSIFYVLLAVVVIYEVFFASKLLKRPLEYLFPSNIFLIGKEIQRNTRRQSLRQNIFWGVIIASVISLLAGLVVWLVTK